MSARPSGRVADQLREVSFERGYTKHAEGSVLVSFGATRVLCTASIEDSVPSFLRGQAQGWVTAEYGMLPRATHTRSGREAARGKQSGRTQEIQRLIGRALRAVVDLKALGERTVTIDCDVLQADGGTRTAAITGGFVALADAIDTLLKRRAIQANPLHGQVAAVSVGIYRGSPVLDLDYAEDSNAETDMNVVMNSGGAFVEVQGTAEGHAFRRHELDQLLDLASAGIARLHAAHSARVPRKALIVATGNPGKLREFRALLADLPFDLTSLGERGIVSPLESGTSFLENALLKARHAAGKNAAAIADDSGLEVDALGGAPGIFSARWAGPQADDAANNAKLQRALHGVPGRDRSARYRCVLAYVERADDATPIIAQGVWEGMILETARGSGGFGYDPYFWLPGSGVTAAELDLEEKNRQSHRALALHSMREQLALRCRERR